MAQTDKLCDTISFPARASMARCLRQFWGRLAATEWNDGIEIWIHGKLIQQVPPANLLDSIRIWFLNASQGWSKNCYPDLNQAELATDESRTTTIISTITLPTASSICTTFWPSSPIPRLNGWTMFTAQSEVQFPPGGLSSKTCVLCFSLSFLITGSTWCSSCWMAGCNYQFKLKVLNWELLPVLAMGTKSGDFCYPSN